MEATALDLDLMFAVSFCQVLVWLSQVSDYRNMKASDLNPLFTGGGDFEEERKRT